MNTGFSNLDELKAAVLPASLLTRTEWDTALTALGLGVALALEKHCNRKFARVAGDTCIFSADRSYLSLPRYPVESVATVEQQDDLATGYVALPANTLLNLDKEAGIADFGTPLGGHSSLVRVTYTGGYFWNTLEPADNGYPTALPSGATAIPADLLHAWHLQCQTEILRTDLLGGMGAGRKKESEPNPESLTISKRTAEMIQPYVRYA